MKVTDEMIAAAYDQLPDALERDVKDALEAALADVPGPVSGPFVLTAEEHSAGAADPASVGKRGVRLLQDAVARAVCTLGPKPAKAPFRLYEAEREAMAYGLPRSSREQTLVNALQRALDFEEAVAVSYHGPAPTTSGGEWTEDDYLTAEAALDHERHRGVKTEKSCHAAKVALDAVKHRLHAPLVLPPAEPQPDAPTDIARLPDYWDERRRRQGKPDLSRCAAEARVALASSSTDRLTTEERACVNSKRHVLEDGEEVLVAIIDRLAPDPDPVSPVLVDAVCKKMQLTGPMDQSFAQAVLETAHALRKAGAK